MGIIENKALTAYDNALGFANAFRVLLNKTSISALRKSGSYSDASMIMPTIVNGAFACELFIKALLKNPPSKGKEAHSLVSLIEVYEREKPGKKDFIQQVCISVMHNIQGNESYSESMYDRDLRSMDCAFYNLRYWHEPINPDSLRRNNVYSLDFIQTFVAVLQDECERTFGPRPLLAKYKTKH